MFFPPFLFGNAHFLHFIYAAHSTKQLSSVGGSATDLVNEEKHVKDHFIYDMM